MNEIQEIRRIRVNGEDEVYTLLSSGANVNNIQFKDNKGMSYNYNFLNYNEVITRDFYDFNNNYIQLRIIQVIPKDSLGIQEDDKQNCLYLYAQNKKEIRCQIIKNGDNFYQVFYKGQLEGRVEKDKIIVTIDNEDYFTYKPKTLIDEDSVFTTFVPVKDNFGFVGQLVVDNDFRISVFDDYLSYNNYDLQNLFSKDYANLFTLKHDSFDGAARQKEYSFYQAPTKASVGYLGFNVLNNHICFMNLKGINNSTGQSETWSILFLPYEKDGILDVLSFAVLKNTKEDIDLYINPSIVLECDKEVVSLYNSKKQESVSCAFKDGNSTKPRIFNDLTYNTQINIKENELESKQNRTTWPLRNKKKDELLLLENCYYTYDFKDWYSVVERNSEGEITKSWIDLINNKKVLKMPDSDNFITFKVSDINNSFLNKNGNIVLQSYNTLSIPIINNLLSIKSLKTNEEEIKDYSVLNSKIVFYKDINGVKKLYYTYLKPITSDELYQENNIYDSDNNKLEKTIFVEFNKNPTIFLRIYKGDE